MKFVLTPVLSMMAEFYGQARSRERFDKYIAALTGGDKDSLRLPIVGFNPMAKDYAVQKLGELIELEAEEVAKIALDELNEVLAHHSGPDMQVVLNLADDAGGAWTNRFTADYSSKFKMSGVAKFGFCTPHFWTSEDYSKETIASIVKAYALRSAHWQLHGDPDSLADHIRQEQYVTSLLSGEYSDCSVEEQTKIATMFEENKSSTDYSLIFNFFYGDEASSSLGYSKYGVGSCTGFEFAKFVSE